ERFQATHPTCRCLVVEWSVWSEVGMGARLGSLEGLVRHGVTPIRPDAGVALLRELLAQPTPTSVVATGRYAPLPTLAIERRPLRRDRIPGRSFPGALPASLDHGRAARRARAGAQADDPGPHRACPSPVWPVAVPHGPLPASGWLSLVACQGVPGRHDRRRGAGLVRDVP